MAYPNLTVVESSNVSLGQAGSIFVTGTSAITAVDGVFIAIQFLEDTIFNSTNSTGLVAATDQLYPSSQYTSTTVSASNGDVIDGETFPQGITIYGRWTAFQLASGLVIAYKG